MLGSLSVTLLLASITYGASLTGVRNQWLDPYSLRSNPLYLYTRPLPSRPPGNIPAYRSRLWKDKDSDASPSRTRPFRLGRRQDASETAPQELDTRPTPQPTGEPSVLTTVFINSESDFALLLPRPGGTCASCIYLRAPPTPRQNSCLPPSQMRNRSAPPGAPAATAGMSCHKVSLLLLLSRERKTIRGSRYGTQCNPLPQASETILNCRPGHWLSRPE